LSGNPVVHAVIYPKLRGKYAIPRYAETICFIPEQNPNFVCITYGGFAELFDLSIRKFVYQTRLHSQKVTAINCRNNLLLSSSLDRSVKLWHLDITKPEIIPYRTSMPFLHANHVVIDESTEISYIHKELLINIERGHASEVNFFENKNEIIYCGNPYRLYDPDRGDVFLISVQDCYRYDRTHVSHGIKSYEITEVLCQKLEDEREKDPVYFFKKFAENIAMNSLTHAPYTVRAGLESLIIPESSLEEKLNKIQNYLTSGGFHEYIQGLKKCVNDFGLLEFHFFAKTFMVNIKIFTEKSITHTITIDRSYPEILLNFDKKNRFQSYLGKITDVMVEPFEKGALKAIPCFKRASLSTPSSTPFSFKFSQKYTSRYWDDYEDERIFNELIGERL